MKENNNNEINTTIPKITILKDLANDSYAENDSDNTFCAFKSIDDILLLFYTNKINSVISYNIITNQKVNEIKKAHEKIITNLRHCLDKSNKRDLILSISDRDNNIKIWNAQNCNCLLSLTNIYSKGRIYSACFLNDNSQIYILASSFDWRDDMIELIKVYDLNGNKIKEIEDSYENIFFIDSYYDNKLSKNFIVTGNEGCSKSYDYNNNKLYHKYYDSEQPKYYSYANSIHSSIVINNYKNQTYLIESCHAGILWMWDFHSGLKIGIIEASNSEDGISGICLWDNDYLLVSSYYRIIVIDIKNKKVIKGIKGHHNNIYTLKTIDHPQYGKCLISHGFDPCIKLWVKKN